MESHISGIIQYLSFCDCIISVNITSSKSIHVVTCQNLLFLLLNDIPLYRYTFCLSILWSLCVFISWFILSIKMVNVSVSCACCESGGLKQQKSLTLLKARSPKSRCQQAMLPPKAPGESPSLLLPASGGCGCKTLTSASVITWPSLLSVSIFCPCQSSLCLSVRTLVMYHLGSTFSLLQSAWWLAQISSQWGLELQCAFNWTKHQRCPKDVSLGAVSPEMPPDTWGSFEKGESHWVMSKTLQTQHQCLSNFGKVIQPLRLSPFHK